MRAAIFFTYTCGIFCVFCLIESLPPPAVRLLPSSPSRSVSPGPFHQKPNRNSMIDCFPFFCFDIDSTSHLRFSGFGRPVVDRNPSRWLIYETIIGHVAQTVGSRLLFPFKMKEFENWFAALALQGSGFRLWGLATKKIKNTHRRLWRKNNFLAFCKGES